MDNEKRLIDANVVYEMGHRTPFHIGIADLCDLKELLADVPTVDAVEVVHGRWIKDGDVVVCSNCGEEHAWYEYRATYCEDCGAKMDGGKGND